MTTPPLAGHIVSRENITLAWADALVRLLDAPGGVGGPFYVYVEGVDNGVIEEHPGLRTSTDALLKAAGARSVQEVANTVFPESLWNRGRDRAELFRRFGALWPKIREDRANRHGHYFQRMVAYEEGGTVVNQLEHVIQAWHRAGQSMRHTALQVNILDPSRDHVFNRRRGFPCLQQVAFTPVGVRGEDGLVVTGLYPTQDFVERGLGNLLGLARLGQFMAVEMGLDLRGVRCVALRARLGDHWGKGKLSEIGRQAREALAGPTDGGASDGSHGDGAAIARVPEEGDGAEVDVPLDVRLSPVGSGSPTAPLVEAR